jgi:hypothetical protein
MVKMITYTKATAHEGEKNLGGIKAQRFTER